MLESQSNYQQIMLNCFNLKADLDEKYWIKNPSLDEISRCLPKGFNNDYLEVKETRTNSVVFFGNKTQKYVMKLMHKDLEPVLREEALMQDEQFEVKISDNFCYCIFPYIEGQVGFNDNQIPVVMEEIFKYHQYYSFHPSLKIFGDWSKYLLTNWVKHLYICYHNNKIDGDELLECFQNGYDFAFITKHFTTKVHNDLSPNNIIINDNGVHLIDWGDSIAGDPIFDLAGFCAFHMPEKYEKIIESYYKNAQKPEDFYKRFWLYYLRIAVSRTVHRIRHKIPDNPDYPPASRRIQLALKELRFLS